jgi:hypothetical protein
MGLRTAGARLWETHTRRIVVYLCCLLTVWVLFALTFSQPLPVGLADLLHWVPLAALATTRTSRDAAMTVWTGLIAMSASAGFGLLGLDRAWISAAVCAGVTLLGYLFYTSRVKRDRSNGSVPPQSCWLRVNDGLIAVEVVPGPDCKNCGHPHIYIGYSAFDRVEVDMSQDPVIEVEPADVPVGLMIATDTDGRQWLYPRG